MYELIEMFAILALPVTFLFSPVIALIVSIVRVVKYHKVKQQYIENPDSYTYEDITALKKSAVAAFITSLILTIIVVAIIILFSEAITYM